MPEPSNRVLIKMLDRLFGAITTGPSLNCRPHSSRQRVDFTSLGRLGDLSPAAALREILGERAAVSIAARVPVPPASQRVSGRRYSPALEAEGDEAPAEAPDTNEPDTVRAARRAWTEQAGLLAKLRVIADEARTYEEDTGVYVLNIGFPLLSLPPGMAGGGSHGQPGTRRILAPIAFIPVSLTIKTGASPAVELECRNDEVDRVSPNQALMAWLEQQTGRLRPADLFSDDEGKEPWREVRELVKHVCDSLKITPPEIYASEAMPPSIALGQAPRAEESGPTASVLTSAVLGLYPLANQGLLHDTQAMLGGDALDGPVASFIRAGARLEEPPPAPTADDGREAQARTKNPRAFEQERLVAAADPCQSRAVVLARRSAALVIHGPPGTGKSQTITNIIGDHLSRSERVLFVCDKRTALDVVANRLEHLGLGRLCAVVHDPQRDQRHLYMDIREQLEALADTKTKARAEQELKRVDEELASLHAELTQHHTDLMSSPSGETSFHDLVGQWLAIAGAERALDSSAGQIDPASLRGITVRQLDARLLDITTVLRRADEVAFAGNPWARCTALGLEEFLARPAQVIRGAVAGCAAAAQEADGLCDPSIPALVTGVSLEQQAGARARLAENMEQALTQVPAGVRVLWTSRPPEVVEAAHRQLDSLRPHIEVLRAGAADAELSMLLRSTPADPHDLTRQLNAVEAYLAGAGKWYGFLAMGRRRAAAKVLARYGLALSPQTAERLRGFLAAIRAMLVLRDVLDQWQTPSGAPPSSAAAPGQPAPMPEQSQLVRAVTEVSLVVDILARVRANPSLAGLYDAVCAALAGTGAPDLVRGLADSGPRAGALGRLEQAIASSGLFDPRWQERAFAVWRRGRPEDMAAETVNALQTSLGTLEGVLRVRDGLARLPTPIGDGLRRLVGAAAPTEQALSALRQAVLAAEITARLDSTPSLRTLDARRMQTIFERYRQLEMKKTTLVRDTILHRWGSRQRERLLASTGSRLNSAGADLRRRLTVRGKKAMRLRQVVAFGQNMEGGDPLMDLRPVWMASPETVAQIFQRLPLFDVVIFDEASQCRLEESLPVLTRANRVVIAGDPKQLPPTRFFESAIAVSDIDEVQTEQQLFEVHQGEIEDLLGAALCLDLERCFLDVHYRSKNSDLVAFSNLQFYSSRLQPIPGHPKNRARYAPISLYRVNGVYDRRANIAEAEQVCRIIRDLLRRADPPTIGVGCFNLVQRDLIIEKLDELSAQDPDFAPRLAAARERRGQGTFEGLFVKNLENLQGDERDHIIISTTYGPDTSGKFYQRFGPLAQPGGGRRLNVLVTRARSEVHLVTSIPREAYHALPPVPEGEVPGGGYLLYAYLNYAEQLSAKYETAHTQGDGRPITSALVGAVSAERALERGAIAADGGRPPPVSVFQTAAPSTLAEAMAHRLAGGGVGSDVYWGNDGFCVDLALRDPARTGDVTIGVLCDTSRFPLADDPIEWDAFRTSILESQGWTLHRVWSPSVFHDLAGSVESIVKLAATAEQTGESPRVTRPRRNPG